MQLTVISPRTTPSIRLDEPGDRVVVIDAAITTAPSPIGDDLSTGPGAYLVLYHGDMPCYAGLRRPRTTVTASIIEGGGYPLYAGSAHDLADRERRHRRKLAASADFDLGDVSLIALRTRYAAAALYTEAILIDEFRPVWNQPWLSGFGSKAQGRVRTEGQRVSPWSRFHPPTGSDSLRDIDRDLAASIEQRIVAHVADTVPAAATIAC